MSEQQLDQAAEPVFRTIQKVISEVARIAPEDILLDNAVTGIQNVDSIILMEIVVRTELELDIEIDEGELFDLHYVRDFVSLCQRLTDRTT